MKDRTNGRKGYTETGSRWASWLRKMLPVVFFFYVFFLYYSLLSTPYFTDEEDVFFGAYNVIKGQDIYRSFLSQHMPFSYYFVAPIALCGARTVFQFRFGVYFLLAWVWETAFLRHRKVIPSAALFLMPLLYLSLLKTINLGTTMISDHWQGIGLVLILLEVVRYADEKRITWPCTAMICLGILLSLGSSFASAYSLLCYFLAAAVLQGKLLRGERGTNGKDKGKQMRQYLREDLRLAGICLLPFVLLMCWYAVSGNLENFYSGAYEIVTQVYSKYTGGMGSDPVGVLWETPLAYGKYLLQTVQNLPSASGLSLLVLISAGGLFFFVIRIGKKSPTAAALILLAAIYGGLRNFEGFHGMAYHAQATAALSLVLGMGITSGKVVRLRRRWRWAVWGAAGTAALGLLSGFVVWAGYNLLYPQILLNRTLRCEERILDLLTEPEEVVFSCNAPVNSLDVMDLELIPKEACGAISYPYFYEMWGARQMVSIQDMPNVVLYNGEESIWGYVFREYAPDFDEYMNKHYIRLPQAEEIWVSGAFSGEALRRLEEAGYGDLVCSNVKAVTENTPVKYFAGQSVKARFTAKDARVCAVRFCAACFNRRSNPRVNIRVTDPNTGEAVSETEITGNEIADNFFSRCPMRAEVIPGREYEVEFTIKEITGKGDMEFYFIPEGDLALAVEYQTGS